MNTTQTYHLSNFIIVDDLANVRGTNRVMHYHFLASDIIWIKYKNNGIQIAYEGNETVLYKKGVSLSTFYKTYPYPFFMQISQNTIVNQEKIKGFLLDTGEVMVIHNKKPTFLSITKTYRKACITYVNQIRTKSQ